RPLDIALLGPDLTHQEHGLSGFRREGLRPGRRLIGLVEAAQQGEGAAALEVEAGGLVETLRAGVEEGERVLRPPEAGVGLSQAEIDGGLFRDPLAQILEVPDRLLGRSRREVAAGEEEAR